MGAKPKTAMKVNIGVVHGAACKMLSEFCEGGIPNSARRQKMLVDISKVCKKRAATCARALRNLEKTEAELAAERARLEEEKEQWEGFQESCYELGLRNEPEKEISEWQAVLDLFTLAEFKKRNGCTFSEYADRRDGIKPEAR